MMRRKGSGVILTRFSKGMSPKSRLASNKALKLSKDKRVFRHSIETWPIILKQYSHRHQKVKIKMMLRSSMFIRSALHYNQNMTSTN